MSYPIENTVWKADEAVVPQPIRNLISRLCEISDTHSPDAGQRLATEVFTPDGVFIPSPGRRDAPPGGYVGAAAIATSLENTWNAMKTRRHTVSRVFASPDGEELMVLGALTITLLNDKTAVMPWASHVEVVRKDTDAPRIKRMQTTADPSAFVDALKG
ncbi:hypothetical protein SEUCBS139899_010854 [Sporothrix eucalyptigena]|uniref:SnoaL-like domain-containing protein n=1 Tax=Sporothrix eucalyptigena TaxID=1812306 RepID=A0ABP0D2B3_9PEZI